LPFAALVIGWVLTRPPPAVATVAIALTAGSFGIAAGSSQLDRHSRPDYPQVADYVDAAAHGKDAIVYDTNTLEAKAIATSLGLYYDREHPSAAEPDPRRWATHSHSSRVVVVTEWAQWERPTALGRAHALVKTAERRFPGIQPLGAAVYRRDPLVGPHSYAVRGGELVPAHGPPLPIRRGDVKGVVQAVMPLGSSRFLFTGWAKDAGRRVDKVVVFANHRVVLADAPWIRRPNGLPGFQFSVPMRDLRAGGQPTGYAILDGAAYRLGRFCDPQVKQPVPCRPRQPA
jgi:hypothetical protein